MNEVSEASPASATSDLERLVIRPDIELFSVKQYDDVCIAKGNGFDGQELGEIREDAEVFIGFVNRCISKAKLYDEIVMCVGVKWKDEMRYETAKRYILERENQYREAAAAQSEPSFHGRSTDDV